jgi:hypothetical protein
VGAELPETDEQEDPMGHDTPDHQPAAAHPHPTPSGGSEVPKTGDAVIDAVVAELAEVRERPLDEHIAAGEKAHRVLQGRLSDLGGE